jgi:hypothetical protein
MFDRARARVKPKTPDPGCSNCDISYQPGLLTVVLPAENTMAINHTANGTTIVFTGAPRASYVTQWASYPGGPWTNPGNAIKAAANGLVQDTDTTFPVPPTRFYQMQCVSGP